MRIALLVLVPLFACASTEPPPPKPSTPASGTQLAPPEPASTAVPSPTPPTSVEEVRLACVSGPAPASAVDGRVAVERIVEMRHDFAMVRTRMNKPPDRAVVTTLTQSELEVLHSLAATVLAGPRPKASPPVPDGTACTLRITIDGTTMEEAVDPTPPPGPTANLVLDLRTRMTAKEPTWPSAKDPEIDTCRNAANDTNVARFTVDEIVIEQDGKHRWMFLDPKELSTANHFGCRIENGKALILPEG